MKIKKLFPLLALFMLLSGIAESQVIILQPRPPRYRMRPARQKQRPEKELPKFEPGLNLSVGYGFPNTDKINLPAYYNEYNGNISQTGPFTGSLDYRFNRNMSIGVLVTHGMIKAPYYPYGGSSGAPDFNVKLDNWAFMLNLMRYIPASKNITIYTRTAIGVNSWNQGYTDASGNKMNVPTAALPDLAYQAGLGAQFKMSKNSGFYVEAGYGKYILNAGISLKF